MSAVWVFFEGNKQKGEMKLILKKVHYELTSHNNFYRLNVTVWLLIQL